MIIRRQSCNENLSKITGFSECNLDINVLERKEMLTIENTK